MRRPPRAQCFCRVLCESLKVALVAMVLAAGGVGCSTAETGETARPAQSDSAGRQNVPLTPEEWRQQNFPEQSGKAAGEKQALASEARRPANAAPAAEPVKAAPVGSSPAALSVDSSPRTNPTKAAVAPNAPPSQSARPANPAPKLFAKASQPEPVQAGVPSSRLPPAKAAAAPLAFEAGETNRPTQVLLREGDIVRVSFPGVPQYDRVQQIRRDGNITLPEIGEYKAAGLSIGEAEKQLVKLYDRYLNVKEVSVSLDSSTFAVYVTGAVQRPGKIVSDRPITLLEAVIEAGIDHAKASLKKVRIIREENGRTETRIINLKNILDGKHTDFELKPSDKIYVPERLSFF